jgi:DNA-directed RNA polymerase specialized sigma24 family protein
MKPTESLGEAGIKAWRRLDDQSSRRGNHRLLLSIVRSAWIEASRAACRANPNVGFSPVADVRGLGLLSTHCRHHGLEISVPPFDPRDACSSKHIS